LSMIQPEPAPSWMVVCPIKLVEVSFTLIDTTEGSVCATRVDRSGEICDVWTDGGVQVGSIGTGVVVLDELVGDRILHPDAIHSTKTVARTSRLLKILHFIAFSYDFMALLAEPN
jgi:hypothetical protein